MINNTVKSNDLRYILKIDLANTAVVERTSENPFDGFKLSGEVGETIELKQVLDNIIILLLFSKFRLFKYNAKYDTLLYSSPQFIVLH